MRRAWPAATLHWPLRPAAEPNGTARPCLHVPGRLADGPALRRGAPRQHARHRPRPDCGKALPPCRQAWCYAHVEAAAFRPHTTAPLTNTPNHQPQTPTDKPQTMRGSLHAHAAARPRLALAGSDRVRPQPLCAGLDAVRAHHVRRRAEPAARAGSPPRRAERAGEGGGAAGAGAQGPAELRRRAEVLRRGPALAAPRQTAAGDPAGDCGPDAG